MESAHTFLSLRHTFLCPQTKPVWEGAFDCSSSHWAEFTIEGFGAAIKREGTYTLTMRLEGENDLLPKAQGGCRVSGELGREGWTRIEWMDIKRDRRPAFGADGGGSLHLVLHTCSKCVIMHHQPRQHPPPRVHQRPTKLAMVPAVSPTWSGSHTSFTPSHLP